MQGWGARCVVNRFVFFFFSGIINYCEGYVFYLLCVQVQLSFSLHCFSYVLACTHTDSMVPLWIYLEGAAQKFQPPFVYYVIIQLQMLYLLDMVLKKNDIHFIFLLMHDVAVVQDLLWMCRKWVKFETMQFSSAVSQLSANMLQLVFSNCTFEGCLKSKKCPHILFSLDLVENTIML